MSNLTIWEPYSAGFAGTLTSLVLRDGRTFTITKNFPHVEKGQPFMIGVLGQQIKIVPVVMPMYWVGMKR
jgi:hypothetical protein